MILTGRLRARVAAAAAVWVLLAIGRTDAQTADHVLLVINESSEDSIQVGEHYARVRAVSQDQIVRIKTPVADEISRTDYDTAIERPVASWLAKNAGQDRILYIVLTKGVPLRVAGTGGRQGTLASVDSELTVLYRKLAGVPVAPQGHVQNPYFLGQAAIADARPFTHEGFDVYLVTRLDGFTAKDAMALVDRARNPQQQGRIVLDMKATMSDKGNDWLKLAAERLEGMGLGKNVQLETTSEVVRDVQDVLGYYSWGSNDHAIRVRRFGFGFVPGAIAGMFVSSDGRTFEEPPEGWTIGNWNNQKTFFAGSPQSLAGDLIREGVTGVSGHVAEPFLDATIRPEILFPAYLSGFTLGEAFYLAMPYLSWQTVVVGDPLCLVAPRKSVPDTALNPAMDPETESPRFFSQRRLSNLQAANRNRMLPAPVLKLTMKAESQMARGDVEGGEQSLLEATRLEPTLTGAQLLLASQLEQRGEYEKAAERYRLLLKTDPGNVVALNNLAYIIAVRQNKPGDGLPLAERAYTLSQGNATIADSVGWIHHLMGNQTEAVRYMTEAVRGAPGNVDVLVHAAAVFAAAGKLDAVRQLIDRAASLDKTVLEREEIKKARAQLEAAGPK